MSFLQQLKTLNLFEEFETYLREYVTDPSVLDEIHAAVDEAGLKSTKTMTLLGILQRNGKTKAGLYKVLVGLQARAMSTAATQPAVEQEKESTEVTQTTSDVPEEKTEVSGGNTVSDEVSVEEKVSTTEDTSNVVQLQSLPGKEEDKIKARLAKEEAKIRAKLLEREAKLRERAKARAEKKAQRKGMKLETLEGIRERKEKMTELRNKRKELSTEIKKLSTEIKELRPQRKKREKKKKDGEVPAATEQATEQAAS